MADQEWDAFRREDGSSPLEDAKQPRRPSVGLSIAIGVLVVAGAIAAYLAFLRPSSAPASPTTAPAGTRPSATPSLGGAADNIELPPLDQSDAVVRRLVGGLSSTPVVEAWLSGSGLVRNLVAVTVNLEEGTTPAKLISKLRPNGPFRVIDRGGRQVIDPRSYERYDAAAEAIVALDPARVARLYATLKPRIEDAYRELGFSGRSFDRALQAVIVTLVSTPIPDDEPRVMPKGARYVYADERFEALTSAQKQFLRMGPRNVRRIDLWLRRLADALGIPPAAFPTR